ncbi:MAG: molybdenum cofactor biosynthesis protein MoaE [Tetragenococcus koreensis]|nr:molybdenum cofactor biosynthesis protein MoaE [Tetragenococcus koreensis]MDN6309692.1 molybdenum cofactor biosynthesis protein MoaE [Psychroflexus sp.]
MEEKKKRTPKDIFVEGPIAPQKIADSIAKHQSKLSIGAHDIFLGQVRADEIDGKTVTAIEYTAYREMALKECHKIREEAFKKFDITCMHIYHSLGTVEAGKLCLFVFTSSPRRKETIAATHFLVEQIKSKLPIFGKECFDDASHQWKVNTL